MPWTLNMCHSSHFESFSQSKSTKYEIFAWIFYFSGTTYCSGSKPVPLDLACLESYIHTTHAILIHFSQSKSRKCEIFAWILEFSTTTYCRDLKSVPLDSDSAHLKPYICATQAILMHFSQSKSTKCEIFGCLLNSPWQKWKQNNINLNMEKVFENAWKSAHRGFWVYQSQCTMLELCVTSTFWVMMVFLDFWQEGLGIGFWNMV